MKLIEALKWRYATKLFDESFKLSNEQLEQLKDVIRLSASSYGLQPYKVIIVEDEALKSKLFEATYKQKQITTCSHIFIFCNLKTVSDKYISNYTSLKGNELKLDDDTVKGMTDYMINTVNQKDDSAQENWTAKQAYIALGNLLAGCAELGLDSCPMEGFDNEGYNKILGLSDEYTTSVIATVGKRSNEDPYQFSEKVRKPIDELFELR